MDTAIATPPHHQEQNIDTGIFVKAHLRDEKNTEALDWFYRLSHYDNHEDFISNVTNDFKLELGHTDFDLSYHELPTLLSKMGLTTDSKVNKDVWVVLNVSDDELLTLYNLPASAFTPNAEGEINIKEILASCNA